MNSNTQNEEKRIYCFKNKNTSKFSGFKFNHTLNIQQFGE